MINQSTLDKLNAMAKNSHSSNKQAFKRVVVKLGVKPVKHFPKMKDSSGKTMKDESGNDLRSETSDGYTYTFSDFETSQVVKVVLDKLYDIKIMNAYLISGEGYEIRNANMLFIDEGVQITEYK